MLLIGLTGNIAAGKSTVSRLFTGWGATVIDADELARQAVAPGAPALDALVARWGPSMLLADGTLNRAALRHIVFGDAAERAALDAIVHPAVARLRAAEVAAAEARGDRLVICDIPLLFEAGLTTSVSGIVLVDAPVAVRRARLVRDRGLEADEADAMINAQWPSEAKRPRANWVIENNGTPAQLEKRARAVYDELVAHATHA